MKRFAIGTDIGGSHISAVVIDLKQEKIVEGSFSSCKVNNKASASEIFENWSVALNKSLQDIDKQELKGIGFAMPGPFDYSKGIALFTPEVDKYENLYGLDIGAELKKFIDLPDDTLIRFMNDATSFAIGEAWIGKSATSKKSMAITLGTGFGSAFIESGIPVLEHPNVPRMGCAWHLPYKDGIADDYFSTRWFIKRYAERSQVIMSNVKEIALLSPTNITAKETFEEFGTNLGEFLTPWIKKFAADCLVIGGNMTGAYDIFGPSLEAIFNKHNSMLNIEISELMETSAMIGSARLMNDNFWKQISPLLSKM